MRGESRVVVVVVVRRSVTLRIFMADGLDAVLNGEYSGIFLVENAVRKGRWPVLLFWVDAWR